MGSRTGLHLPQLDQSNPRFRTRGWNHWFLNSRTCISTSRCALGIRFFRRYSNDDKSQTPSLRKGKSRRRAPDNTAALLTCRFGGVLRPIRRYLDLAVSLHVVEVSDYHSHSCRAHVLATLTQPFPTQALSINLQFHYHIFMLSSKHPEHRQANSFFD